MKIVTTYRANDAQPCTIVIGEPLNSALSPGPGGEPPSTAAIASAVTFEADAIAQALFDHLPLAVTARLNILLMQRYATNALGGPRR